jgi:hypothetical protein
MMACRLATFVTIALTGLSAVAAQRYADLNGRVLDTSGGGIADAEVTVVSQDTGFRRATQSELGGVYDVASLEPGLYKITVRREGFRTLVQFNVPLHSGRATPLDFVLPVGSTQETVTVEGAPPLIDRDDASTGSSFHYQEMEHLPLNGGGLLNLIEALPGTNVTPATRGEAGQFTTGGQRPNTNYFMVDGVSANIGVTAGGLPAQATAGTLPPVTAFGSLDSLIPVESVQDFTVRTSSTGAEMGRMPGAQVAATSRSGSNDFHGATAYRWRNEVLAANDWFANQASLGRGELRLNDISQTFGGPVKRNSSFFFLSYQHISLMQPYVWDQAVPSAALRQNAAAWAQSVLDVFPAPNEGQLAQGLGNWVGRSVQPATLNAGAVRLDQAIGKRVSVFARYSDSPSSNQFGNFTVNRIDLRFQSLTLALTARPTAGTTVDARVNESQATADSLWADSGKSTGPGCALQPLTAVFLSAPAGCDHLVRLTIGGVGQVVSGREGERVQRQFQTVEWLGWAHGGHSVQIGADYRRLTPIREDATGTLGVIVGDPSLLTGGWQNVWRGQSPALNRRTDLNELSLWILDTWHAASRITISAGLRWEFSPAPTIGTTDPVYFFDYASKTMKPPLESSLLWPTSHRDFAPRLGLAWRLTGDGKTVLRAGGGLYYESSMSIASDFINSGPWSVDSYDRSSGGPFSSTLISGFLPDLRLPAVGQWNLAIDRAVSTHGTVSVAYVGSASFDLIRREVGGPGSTLNSPAALTTNHGHSEYQSFQAQYRRRFSTGLDVLASYTWAHSIDNDSSDAFLLWAGTGGGAAADRGPSDFDLRHSFNGTLSYTLPTRASRAAWSKAMGGWTLSALWRLRSGFPITVLDAEQYTGITLVNAFRPLRMPGQPVWIADRSSPGGWRLNAAAFQALSPDGTQGNLGRNSIAGFGMGQVDVALSREMKLRERAALELFGEAFNVMNHPCFADPVRYLNSPLFGHSTSMLNMMLGTGSPGSGLSPVLGTGGPRMVQLGLRFRF